MRRLVLLAGLVLLASGCSRVDTLRLAHANTGTRVDWPPGAMSETLALQPSSDGRAWVPVRVDESAPVPFLLHASAGAIALTGASASGFGPAEAGRVSVRGQLLPGITGGLMIKQRRLALGGLVLREQSLLLVEAGDWPDAVRGQSAAGVFGWDIFRRFVVELDVAGGRMVLHRRGGFDVGSLAEVQRLAVLARVPYFEAWLDTGHGAGRWVRLQFEPGHAGGACLDAPGSGHLVVAGQRIGIAPDPCPAPARTVAGRDGIFGAAALAGLVVGVDYDGGRIGFRPR